MSIHDFSTKGKLLYKKLGINPNAFIDKLLFRSSGEAHLDLPRFEQWLQINDHIRSNESIEDCLTRKWGKEVAEVVKALI